MDVTPLRIAGKMQVTLPKPQVAGGPAPAAPVFDTVNINFSYDKSIKQVVVTLYDAHTGEVVREIPAEKIRHFIACMMEMLAPQFEARV